MGIALATRKETRNRLRLPSETAFLEALESSEDLPGRILAVHRSAAAAPPQAAAGGAPAAAGSAPAAPVVVELPPAGEALERLTALAAALGGDFAAFTRADQAALRRPGEWRTFTIEEYLESLALLPVNQTPGDREPREHWRGEHVAFVRGSAEEYRRALRALLRFNFDEGSGVLEAAAVQGAAPGYLIRFRGLASVYPLLEWEENPAVTLFTPFQESGLLHVQKGFRHPLRRVEDYHGRLGELTLAPARGPWVRLDGARFAPITASVEVSAGAREEPVALTVKDFGPDERLEVRLELVSTAADAPARSREGHLRQRIERLEKFRDRTNARLSELYGILEPASDGAGSKVLYCFADSQAEALHAFLSSYPFSLIKGFRYLPVSWKAGEKDSGVVHFLEPIDRAALPPLVAVDCEVYRPDGNFDRLGIPLYIPAGEKLWPAVHFSPEDAAALSAGILGAEQGGEKLCVLRRLAGSKELLKLVIDRADFRPLNESVRFLNRTVRRAEVEALTRSAASDVEAAGAAQAQSLQVQLQRAEEAVRAEIAVRLEALRGEADSILAEVEQRRAALAASGEKLEKSAELDKSLDQLDERAFQTLEGLVEALREAAVRRFQDPSPRRAALLDGLQKLGAELSKAFDGSVGALEREADGLETRWKMLEGRMARLSERIAKSGDRHPPNPDEQAVLDRAVRCLLERLQDRPDEKGARP